MSDLKYTIIMVIGVLGMLFLLAWCKRDPGHHKYRVEYKGYGNYSDFDYTDSVTVENGCVTYIDHNGREKERCGTFEIVIQSRNIIK